MSAALVPLAVLAVLILAGVARSEPPARADAYDDPLPLAALHSLTESGALVISK
jgi:hypothetical protein